MSMLLLLDKSMYSKYFWADGTDSGQTAAGGAVLSGTTLPLLLHVCVHVNFALEEGKWIKPQIHLKLKEVKKKENV